MVKVVNNDKSIKWEYDPIEWEFMKVAIGYAEELDKKVREILKQGKNK